MPDLLTDPTFIKYLYATSYPTGRALIVSRLSQENYDQMQRHEIKIGRYMVPFEILQNWDLTLPKLSKEQHDDFKEQLAKRIYKIDFSVEDSDVKNYHKIDFSLHNEEIEIKEEERATSRKKVRDYQDKD